MIKAHGGSQTDGGWLTDVGTRLIDVWGAIGRAVLHPRCACVICNCPGRYSKWGRGAAVAERHDSTTEQGCFEAGREVGEWVGGGGQQRWQQSGGWWDFQGAVQVQVQDVDGRGWCSGSTCLGLDWAGTGRGTGDSRAARGPRAEQGGTGTKIGGTLYGKVEGDAVQLHNVGAPKKAMGWGRPSPKSRCADGRRLPNRICG